MLEHEDHLATRKNTFQRVFSEKCTKAGRVAQKSLQTGTVSGLACGAYASLHPYSHVWWKGLSFHQQRQLTLISSINYMKKQLFASLVALTAVVPFAAQPAGAQTAAAQTKMANGMTMDSSLLSGGGGQLPALIPQNFSPMGAAGLMNVMKAGTATASGSASESTGTTTGSTVGTGTTGNAATQTSTDSQSTAGKSSISGSASGGVVGTFTYSGSQGTANNFAVGTSSSLGTSASASSTSDYKVDSKSMMNLDSGTKFTQSIGSFSETGQGNGQVATGSGAGTGIISGSFVTTGGNASTDGATSDTASANVSNKVEVAGIANTANVLSAATSTFGSTIGARKPGDIGVSNSGTANGSAGTSLNSSATANSSTSGFASTFIQSF